MNLFKTNGSDVKLGLPGNLNSREPENFKTVTYGLASNFPRSRLNEI